MDKPKKISISFYLNKQLKDRQFNGKSHYPVYARVLFNQMSNRLPFTTTFKFGFFSEEEFNSFVNHRTDPVIKAELKDFEQTIERIIRFEYGIQEEKFKLVGLKEKLISYQQNMLRELEIILNRLLISHLGIANIDPERMTFGELYLILEANDPEMRKRITGQLEAQIEAFLSLLFFLHTRKEEAPRLLDWLNPDFQAAYKSSLFANGPGRDKVLDRDPVFRKLLTAFPVQISRLPLYLSTLDRLVVQAAG